MFYLLIIYMKNTSEKIKMEKVLVACLLFVLCIHLTTFTHLTTFHSRYMENALAFSQSDVRNFFMYPIKRLIRCMHAFNRPYHKS